MTKKEREEIAKQIGNININEVHAELCRRSYFYFVQQFWDVIIAEEPVWNWHIPYMCGELQEIALRVKRREPFEFAYYLFNSPPGSSKSTIASQMYIAWTWTIDPTQRFICGSYSQTIARKDATFTQNIINSEKYKRYFPYVKLVKDAVDLLRNTENGERYVATVGSGITGVHAHQIIVDDPLSPKQSSSEAERANAKEWFDLTLHTRKVDKKITPTILVMQRLHEDDPTGHILSKGMKVKHICLPAEEGSDINPPELRKHYVDGLLDPIRLDRKVLAENKKFLGSYGYSGQFEQKPAPAEGGMIKKAWFKVIEPTSVPKVRVDFCCDTAYTEDERNDPSGIMAYSVSGPNLYIRNFGKGHFEFPNLIKFIPEFAKQNGYSGISMIYVEPKASGKDVVSTLRSGTHLNIKASENPTKDKEARVNDIVSYIEAGRVYLVRGGWNDEFIQQCAIFPNGKHDEEIDCLVMACQKAFKSKGLIHIR
jgi:predicted phage terminase large subunit-like protein